LTGWLKDAILFLVPKKFQYKERGVSVMKRKMIILAMATLLLSGCGSLFGTVRFQIDDPGFQVQNQPIRNLRVAVFSDGQYSQEEIYGPLREISETLEKQVGIRLQICLLQPITWEEKSSLGERLHVINRAAKKYGREKFDIAIGFEYSASDAILAALIGGMRGITDDTYRRYVVVKTADEYVLAHEICHTFIFSHGHSATGLMQSMTISVFPGTPGINTTIYLSPEDRAEVLENKWRDFNVRPQLDKENQGDLLEE